MSTTSWTPLGPGPIKNGQVPGRQPVAGRITALAASSTDANTIYVTAAGGGVWKTTDGGTTWSPRTDAQSTLFMGAIAIAPSNQNVIYAGTGEPNNSLDSFYGRGILKSTDAGANWTLLAGNAGKNEFDRRTIGNIVVDPSNANIVYVAVSDFGSNGLTGNAGIWKTTDGGTTWKNTTANITTFDPYSDLVIDPTDATRQTLYMAIGNLSGSTNNGVYKTTNGGASWARAGNFPSGVADGRISIAISKTSPAVLYSAIVGSGQAGTSFGHLNAMEKSTNGGQTWTKLTATPDYFGSGGQGWYDTTLIVDPTNANIVYAGGAGDDRASGSIVIKTTKGGTSWSNIANTPSGANGPHADHHAIGFDARGRLLVGNDGGIWRLDNANVGSISWTDLNGNLQITQFTVTALDPTNANVAYGGSQDNGTEKFSDSRSWSLIDFGDGGFVRVDPNNPNVIYHEFFGVSLVRSTNGGSSFVNANLGINASDPGNFYLPFIIDPSNSSRLLLGTNNLYVTTSQGNSWTKIGTAGASAFNTAKTAIDALAVAKTSSSTIYVSAGGHLFVTTNNGTAWKGIDVPGVRDTFLDIQVDPTNANTVYVAATGFGHGHIFKSTNAGTSWTNISGNLPDIPGNAFALDPSSGNLFLGTDIGVFFSTNNGSSWARFGNGFPNVQVISLELNRNLGILAAGTHGRGLWEIMLSPAPAVAFKVAIPAGVKAGTPFNLTVTALDAAGNTAFGYTGKVHFSSTDGAAVLPADFTFPASDKGVHVFSVTLKTAGSRSITVNDTATTTVRGTVTTSVGTATATKFVVMTPTAPSAGAPFNLTVMVLDQFDNVVTDYTGTVHFSSTDGQAALPGDFTFAAADHGAHTFTNEAMLAAAGTQSIDATDTVMDNVQGSMAADVAPAPAVHFALEAPRFPTAGTPFTLVVKALDPFDNVDPTYRGTVHFSSSDPGAVVPPDYTFTAADNGVHAFTDSAITTIAGYQWLVVQDVSNTMAKATMVVNVAAGAITRFRLTAPPTVTVGVPFNITVTATDAQGNAPEKLDRFIQVDFTSPGFEVQPLGVDLNNPDGTFSIKLIYAPDATDYSARQITLRAFNFDFEFSGTIVGTTTLTIDPGPTVSFVKNLYHDVLNRDPDMAGMQFWVSLTGKDGRRNLITKAFWESAEHRGIQVDSFYTTFLHRASDANGRVFWIKRLAAGLSENDVVLGFLNSSEYLATHADTSAFVTALYTDVLGRAPDVQRSNWDSLAAIPALRGIVAQGFVNSQEHSQRLVDALYSTILHRQADAAGAKTWTDALFARQLSVTAIAEIFLASEEYFGRPA